MHCINLKQRIYYHMRDITQSQAAVRKENTMITSTANAQVKELIRLMKKSRAREEAGVFIVEGPRMAGELTGDPAWKERIDRIYLSESYAGKHKEDAEELVKTYRMEILADHVFTHVSDTKSPQGILAVVRRKEYGLRDITGGEPGNPLVVVLDNLQDPGNLGTIFRTGEAAGATGILLSRDCVDIYNPKVIRSTMGAVFRLPFLYVDDLPGAVCELKQEGIRVFAAHLDGRNAYDQEDYSGGTAFLIGNEGNGLRGEVAECADCRVRIPMQGRAESLNAAVAAAVLMFEAGRQRRQ